jgi:hypothetical protein
VRGLDPWVFTRWFLLAMGIKLLGIFANVVRWQVLLRGQGIDLRLRFLCSTYFIGRYFGILTPSTMGLDGWRLYETIRLTRKPVECTTALAVERLVGLVGLFAAARDDDIRAPDPPPAHLVPGCPPPPAGRPPATFRRQRDRRRHGVLESPDIPALEPRPRRLRPTHHHPHVFSSPPQS